MAEKKTANAVTPGQAQWIVERLIADRRISAADVRGLLSNLREEIGDIERRLASLRQANGTAGSTASTPRIDAPTAKTKKRAVRRKRGHVRGIAGTLIVLLRSIPITEHAAIEAIRASKGIKAAIKAAQRSAKSS